MKITKIKYAYVSGYASDDTGEIMTKGHPSLLLKIDYNKELIVPFTSEIFYGVKEKGFYIENNGWYNTAIRTEKEKNDAISYYRKIGNRRKAENIAIGSICYHYIENHKSYISEMVPLLESNEKLKVSKICVDIKEKKGMESIEQIKDNKEFMGKGLRLAETAMLLGKIDYYISSDKPLDRYLDIDENKFSMKERVNMAYSFKKEALSLDDKKTIPEVEYVKKIIDKSEKLGLNVEEVTELLAYKLELQKNILEEKCEKLDTKLEQLNFQKKEFVAKLDIDNFTKIKKEIELVKGKILEVKQNDVEITKEIEKTDNAVLDYEKKIKDIEINFSDKYE